MNTRPPYDIVDLEELAKMDPEKKKGYVPIEAADAESLSKMGRKDRRAWMARNRKRLRREAREGGQQ